MLDCHPNQLGLFTANENMDSLHIDSDEEPDWVAEKSDHSQNKEEDVHERIINETHIKEDSNSDKDIEVKPDVNRNHKDSTDSISGGSKTDQKDGESPFDTLPNEIVNYIFSFLSTQDLSRASSVCKKWQAHASDPVFWTKIDFKCKDTDISEVCRVIEQLPCVKEIRLCELENLNDEDFRQIVSVCPASVKSLNIGFLRELGRDSILAIAEYLPYLEQLNMEGCGALNNNTITALIKLKSLTDLNISHCLFLQDIHVQTILSNLPLLEIINIDGLPDVSDTAIKKLWQHCGTWLKELQVDGANLTDLAMDYVSRCTELRTFMLSFGDNLSDVGLQHILTMKKLTKLKLRKCSGFSTEILEKQFREKEALSQLRVLDISECLEFNDSVVFAMTDRCPHLQELSLAWCWDITDAGVAAIIHSCPDLRELNLTGLDKIIGDVFEDIPEKTPGLVYLSLGQCNQINDELVRSVAAKMPKLAAYNYYGLKFGSDEDCVLRET